MTSMQGKLFAMLATAWEAEVLAAVRLELLSSNVVSPTVRARLEVLSSFCRAHSTRLLARLSAMGRGPLPVPNHDLEESKNEVESLFRLEIVRAHASASRYVHIAQCARGKKDLSSAWVCELNRAEEHDTACELARLLQCEVDYARGLISGA